MSVARSCVLVIDDQRFQRRTLARMLEGLGVARVLEAADGTSALEIVRDHRDVLELIVSDVDMPEMDGLEFLRCLAEEAPNTAVAIHSALDRSLLKSVELMTTEYGLRLVGLLEKPVTEAQLRSTLELARRGNNAPVRLAPQVNAAQVTSALRNHEFTPWFQPKVDLQTAQVCGAEVLVRWCCPNIEPLPPDRFLSVISASGLMRTMTLGLAEQAAQSLAHLGRRGNGFTLSLNICPTLLDDPGFADALAGALVAGGASPDEVILEITESAAARNQGAALENIARLRMRGFILSIDDFGTGFSSLAQLVRMPFSELKIDRSFVSRIELDGPDRLLVDSTVALAHRLGLRTVAEGVETQAQIQFLQKLGCDMAQGYLFAKPMPMDEWVSWMAERQPQNAPVPLIEKNAALG
jgi:EAL domain-containing protein (putative c-di-GMP-specific phosphodiesterase class I)/AmiR/NasT family two-component response regulator